MNKIYSFIISALILIIPLLMGFAFAFEWMAIVKVLLVLWLIGEWSVIAITINILSEGKG